MKTILWALLLSAFQFSGVSAFAQGSLTPSTAPTPTMKSLDQVEARTVIDSRKSGFTLPYAISTSGSYYLAANIAATGSTAGIIVSADNVTIDLNGFALIGGGSGVAAGIDVPAAQKNLCVRNGTVSGWSGNGISGLKAASSRYEKLHFASNNGNGLATGLSCTVKDCIAELHPFNSAGISAGTGSAVVDCAAYANIGDGFLLATGCTIVNSSASSNLIGISTNSGCSVVNCGASGNSSGGIAAFGDSTVVNCVAYGNTSYGISVSTGSVVRSCAVSTNGTSGIVTSFGCMVADCNATFNGIGISVQDGSTARNCTVQSNTGNGIVSTNNCFLIGNTCDSNNTVNGSANAGIYTTGTRNTIDSNTCTANGNGGGIISTGTKNIIIRNSCSGNGFNYNILGASSGNAIGPVIDMSAGGTISNTNPSANWIH